MPHYWLGMVLVIIFSVMLGWLPAVGAGPAASWAWDWAHIQYLILPAVTMSVIPMGIVTRTVRALVGDLLVARNSSWRCAPKGLSETRVFRACGEERGADRASPSWACSSAICSAARS